MRTALTIAAALMAQAAACVAADEERQDGNSFAVSQARMFDGERVIRGATLIVRDGWIETVAADASVPPDLPVVDGRGMTLIPGLIGSHGHVFPGAQADALRFGVTTELDMYHLGGAAAAAAFRARRKSLARTAQADTWRSLAGITPPGGHLSQQNTLAAEFGRERPEILEHALESIGRFHAAGVAVLAGTDAPNPGTAHGPSMHQELELLVEAGLSPAAALNAATALPAERFGLVDRGRIAPGMRADLMHVDGDPTADITRTRQIVRIWKNGYEVDRAAAADGQ